MSPWDFGGPPAGNGPAGNNPAASGGDSGEHSGYGGYGGYGYSGYSDDFEGGAFNPISYERDPYPPRHDTAPHDTAPQHDTARFDTARFDTAQRYDMTPPRTRLPWPDESWPPRIAPRSARPRWLAAIAVAVVGALAGGSVVLLSSSHRAGPSASGAPGAPGTPGASSAPAAPSVSARPAPSATRTGQRGPLTLAQAQRVLARYTTANNDANTERNDALLATIETGSSYAIDAGVYRVQRAEKAAPYPSFAPRRARFYIPRQSASVYPHWFVVQAVNASLANPAKVTGTEYVVFIQAAAGAPWRNVIEPYLVGGTAIPRVAIGADGLATPVSLTAASLAVAPGMIARLTAASLDGAKAGLPAAPGAPGAAWATNLADRLDQKFWRHAMPAATVTDRHLPRSGRVFGLRTVSGGALIFYTDTAELTLIPPAGEAMHLTIPGFFSPDRAVTAARLSYNEQFAAYVPPRGGSGLRIVADYSGITGKN